MNKYKCTVCGWIYDPEIGDLDGGINQEHALKISLVNGYALSCGARKDQFEKLD